MKRFLKILSIAIGSLIVLLAIGVLWAGSAEQYEYRKPPASPALLSTDKGSFDFSISPVVGTIDVPLQISLSGLSAGETVILRASTTDGNGVEFSSWARFLADDNGNIDLHESQPESGSYQSIDSSGLLWSMVAADESSYQHSETVSSEYLFSAETIAGLARTTITRIQPWASLDVERIQTDKLNVEFWLPSDEGPHPAIVRLHGSEGQFDPVRSSLLVEYGFAVLDLKYVEEALIPEIAGIPIEKVIDGIDWLTQHEQIDPDRIALYGGSKGAELALLVAARDSRVAATVAWAPSSVAFEGISLTRLSPGSSWSWRGEEVAYAPYSLTNSQLYRHLLRTLFTRTEFAPVYQSGLNIAPESAYIEVENIEGTLLLLSGDQDRMWPSTSMANQIEARMRENGNDRVSHFVYAGVGHNMKYELWPSLSDPGRFVKGGTAETNHLLGRAGWMEIVRFFEVELL